MPPDNCRRPVLLALTLALLTPGCSTPRETIRGSDSSTVFLAGRVSHVLSSSTPTEGDRRRTQTLLDLDISGSHSSFVQTVPSGQSVEIGGAAFTGPVDVDFDLTRLAFNLRHGRRGSNGVGAEVFVGLGYNALDLRGVSTSQMGSQSFEGVGPLVGLALFYEPTDWLRLYAEGSLNPTLNGGDLDAAAVEAVELGASVRLLKQLGLRAAWRHQTYEVSNDRFDSDLDLAAWGPAITLWCTL